MNRKISRWLMAITAVLALIAGVAIPTASASASATCDISNYAPDTGGVMAGGPESGSNYAAVFQFVLTPEQVTNLRCMDEYLEIDFHVFNFGLGIQWENYRVFSNIPGAMHDTAASDFLLTEQIPGLTNIKTADLVAGKQYYAMIVWWAPFASANRSVGIGWVPSYWASFARNPLEWGLCVAHGGDPRWCIFGDKEPKHTYDLTKDKLGGPLSFTLDRSWRMFGAWSSGTSTSSGGGGASSTAPAQEPVPPASAPITDGSFVNSTQTGALYVVAGGSPLRVASWANVGGAHPYSNVDQSVIDGMRPYPADGTYVQGLPSGRIFVFAGGAPMQVSSWANVGGAHSFVGVDDYALDHQDHTLATPVDGTYINGMPSGRLYVTSGGAPLRIANWNNVGGAQPYTTVDDWAVDHLDHLGAYPADGTYVNALPSGRVYVFAGGSPLRVADWNNVGGAHPYAVVDDYAVDHQDHTRMYPADNTYVTAQPSGRVMVFAGGTAMRVANWANVGGVKPFTTVDDYPIDHGEHTLALPADGSVLTGLPSGNVYVVAGGAPMRVSNWSNIGGVRPGASVDDWAVGNQLRATPLDGTYVTAQPSGRVLVFAGGAPLRVANWANVGGVKPFTTVDDYPIDHQDHTLAYPANGTVVQGYTTGRQYLVQNQLAVVQSPPLGGILVVDDWAVDNQLLAAH